MNEFQTDQDLQCPYCKQKIIRASGVTPGHSGTIRKHQLFVCASCGHLSKVGDFNLQMISDEDFHKLPPHIQQAVAGILDSLKDNSVNDRRN